MIRNAISFRQPRDLLTITLLFCLSAFIAFPIVMSTLAPYDDQGYVMMTIQTFHEGASLYGGTHTQYGPAFYFLTDALHFTLGWPLTQDGVRLKTILFWSLSTVLCFASLRRMRVSLLIAVGMAMLLHCHLEKLALEPGHPQEWILILSMLTLWFAVSDSKAKWVLAGSATALVGMIKLNCGFAMAVPLIVYAMVSSRSEGKNRWAFIQVVVSGTLLTAILVALTLMTGTTLQQLIWGLVLQHSRFTSEFYHGIPMSREGLLFAGLSLVVFLWCRFRMSEELLPSELARREEMITSVKAALVLVGLLSSVIQLVATWGRPLSHGLEVRGAASWLVLVGPALTPWLFVNPKEQKPLCWFLAVGTCLAPIVAVPTPGTQLSLGTVNGWLVLATLVNQVFSQPLSSQFGWQNIAIKVGAIRIVGLLSVAFLIIGLPGWTRWMSNSSIQLPGSALLRLDAALSDQERRIAVAIKQTKCKHLVFDGHNHNRFFFWTGLKSLTAANPTFWPRMLTEEEQDRVVHALSQADRVCVVIPPESDVLAGSCAKAVRLKFLHGWQETCRVGDWRIGVRNTKPGSPHELVGLRKPTNLCGDQ